MKILVTGAKGFVGRNLVEELKIKGFTDIYEYDMDSTKQELTAYTKDCDFVFHLAGVNRPEKEEEFLEGNLGFVEQVIQMLEEAGNTPGFLLSSSIQAERDNPYGKSKLAGEEAVFAYGKRNDVDVYVYRLNNLFGKWSRPNYNTVIATFCHNIARDIEIKVDNPDAQIRLTYIDDLIEEFLRALDGKPTKDEKYCIVPGESVITVGHLADTIQSFKASRKNLLIPNMEDRLTSQLYSTYLSFLPTDNFSYPVKMNVDQRGSFTELLKSADRGQVSVNISKPGITKGNHWHHSKNEKFIVVSGEGLIQFRKIGDTEVYDYRVSGEKIEVVDIPTGYTHNIINVGETDLVTIMWANELFNPEKPDTYFEEV